MSLKRVPLTVLSTRVFWPDGRKQDNLENVKEACQVSQNNKQKGGRKKESGVGAGMGKEAINKVGTLDRSQIKQRLLNYASKFGFYPNDNRKILKFIRRGMAGFI